MVTIGFDPSKWFMRGWTLQEIFGSESGTFLASQMKSYWNGNLKCRKDERGRVVPTSITDHWYPRLVPVQYKFEETKRGLANVMDFPKGSLAESQT
jgi:hypothetical protein